MEMALTKTERVINHVKQLLLSGDIVKGDMLPSENELSKQCGVSRVTTRKALGMLTDMGLIETRRGIGSFAVTTLLPSETPEERSKMISAFKDSFCAAINTKKLIDPEIAKYLALRATKKDLVSLEDAFQEMEDSFAYNVRYKNAGHEYHMAFVRVLNNPMLLELYEKLEDMESPFDQLYLLGGESQTRIKEIDLEQHREILQAIKDHDQDTAYYLTKQHLNYFDEYYQKSLIE